MEKKPLAWSRTLFTQISLLFTLFIAFNIGGFERFITFSGNNIQRGSNRPPDLYFLSVVGGFRPLKQQTQLLKQMEKMAKVYDVKFVINISELGADDPLMESGSLHYSYLKITWYATNFSQGQGTQYFLKQINLQQGRTLDIIVVDTRLLQDYLPPQKPMKPVSDQLSWLTAMLEVSDSNWRIVIGLDPLLDCEENMDKNNIKNIYVPLYNILLKYGVNAYLSKHGCSEHYIHDGSIAHIAIQSPTDKAMHKSPSPSGSSMRTREMQDGFVLHRVGFLEMVSYFMNSTNDVVLKSILDQRGKAVM